MDSRKGGNPWTKHRNPRIISTMTLTFTELLKQLHADPEVLVLTANQRLATHILEQYEIYHQQIKSPVWATPHILTFNNWFQEIYQNLLTQNQFNSILLNDKQIRLLWQQLINEYNVIHDVPLQIQQTAKTCMDAWSTLKQWNIELASSLFNCHEDSQTFYKLAKQFSSLCQKLNVIDTDSCQQQLLNYFKNKTLHFPSTIRFVGFVDLTPLQQSWISLAKEQGSSTQFFENTCQSEITAFGCENTICEIEEMAAWIAQEIHQGTKGTLLCVIPKLADLRSEVEYQFARYFKAFQLCDVTYNISGGNPLSSYDLIQQALWILKIDPQKIPTIEFARWVQLPYLADSQKEKYERVKLAQWLLKKSYLEFSWKDLLNYDEIISKTALIIEALKNYFSVAASKPKKASPSDWILYIEQALQYIGWPGERTIQTLEYQLFTRWQEVLIEFASLDYLFPQLSYTETIQLLNDLVNNTMFQQESKQAQIQVLGLLEAIGYPCEKMWVSGLDDQSWPASAKPNPFIPYDLQKKFQMPHANADKELQFSRHVMQLLAQATPTLIFSYPEYEKEAECNPSPLIAKYLSRFAPSYDKPLFYVSPQAPLETIDDYQTSSLPLGTHLQGGAQIIKNQSLCPFKAYAEQRLHAQEIEMPETAYKKYEQGIHIHAILEKFWGEIKNSNALNELTEEQLIEKIENAVVKVIFRQDKSSIKKIKPIYKNLEKFYLTQLVFKWLNYEKNRNYPFEVIFREESKNILLGNLKLTIKIDRIDKIDDEHHLIIDYKSGDDISYQDCLGERPNEPQLPLYAISAEQTVSGVFFAKIHIKEQRMIGLTSLENVIMQKNRQITYAEQEWADLLSQWNKNLENLAQEIQQGYANVSPKSSPHEADSPCTYCSLHSLCRVYEGLNHD